MRQSDFEGIMQGLMESRAINAVAQSWASIDGKLECFESERDVANDASILSQGGYYEGYLTEAAELVRRLATRGFKIVPILNA